MIFNIISINFSQNQQKLLNDMFTSKSLKYIDFVEKYEKCQKLCRNKTFQEFYSLMTAEKYPYLKTVKIHIIYFIFFCSDWCELVFD